MGGEKEEGSLGIGSVDPASPFPPASAGGFYAPVHINKPIGFATETSQRKLLPYLPEAL